jgi:DUF971 family protein
MEALTTLMQTLDLNSKIISEGDYLKMCDSIKKIHDYIKYESESESEDEEEFRIRRVDIPIPFSPVPRLPPFGDNLDDLTIYDTTPPPPQSRRGDFVHVDLPPIQTPPPVPEPLRDYILEDNLIEVNRLIHETLKKMEKLKHRRNVTNVVRKEAVKRRAQELGIRLRNYTIHALFDAGHDVGNARLFFKTYLEDYNDDIDRQYEELSAELKELEHEKTLIIDELINF